jgi:divalent metal cation (Fe/Co/Zn/Cd) transporter
VDAIRATILAVPGIRGCHNLRTRKMGDLIGIDVHIDVDAELTVQAAHAIVQEAEVALRASHPVLSLMTHIDPWRP